MSVNLLEHYILLQHIQVVKRLGANPRFLYQIPNGFEDQFFRMEKDGIDAQRVWRNLKGVTPNWRQKAEPHISVDDRTAGEVKIQIALDDNILSPTVFTDIDHAIIEGDAQQIVDKKAVKLATLEKIGFIAKYYRSLLDFNIHLSTIRNGSDEEENLALGQQLFRDALITILQKFPHAVHETEVDRFTALLEIEIEYLNNDDFSIALKIVSEPLYTLIIGPLTKYIESHYPKTSEYRQGGVAYNFELIAALSHLSTDENDFIKYQDLFDFNFSSQAKVAVTHLLNHFVRVGCDVIAVTRGSQLPFMAEARNGFNNRFKKAFTTLIWSNRNPLNGAQDSLDANYELRPYSNGVDDMEVIDKSRIIIHVVLEKFCDAGLTFNNDHELHAAVEYYLNRCLLITDADPEVRWTLPFIEVDGIRSPSAQHMKNIAEISTADIPLAVATIGNKRGLLTENIASYPYLPDFDISNTTMGRIIDCLANKKPVERHIGVLAHF